ncbi:hypothetical protein [Citricoccus nitrophenolicus]|uniref:hypothetical protein n=1 Tax=Citricoccus nitrophenolicus TaxID=863575 RepID=UPI0031E710A7
MPTADTPGASGPAGSTVPETLFLSTIPGASPSKWVERFTSRERRVQLVNHDDGAQVAFLAPGPGGSAPRGLPQVGYLRWRLDSSPEALLGAAGVDPEDVHVVRFYEEDPVVCVGQDHLLAAWDVEADGPLPASELDPSEAMDPVRFAPEPPADPLDAPELPGSGERTAVEIVATGAGHVVLPASVARMFGRRDVVVLPLTRDTTHPGWGVGLAWLRAVDSQLVQDFIGAAKGRRPGSSRNDHLRDAPSEAAPAGRVRAGSGAARPGPPGKTASGTQGARSVKGARSGKGARGGRGGRRR